MADMDANLVRYNKLSESVFIQIVNETLEENDENRNRAKIIAKRFFQKLSKAQNLLKKLKTPEVENELDENERAQLTQFLNGFLGEQIGQIVKDEKNGTKYKGIPYTSQHFLLLSRFFLIMGDRRMAAECLWGMAAIELKIFALKECAIELGTHNSLHQFCGALGWDLKTDFNSCSIAHYNGFYEDIMTVKEIKATITEAKDFVDRLRNKVKLTPEAKRSLKKQFA